MTTDVETYIARLQAEARVQAIANKQPPSAQYHYGLKAWVSDNSSAVRLLRDFAAQQEENQT